MMHTVDQPATRSVKDRFINYWQMMWRVIACDRDVYEALAVRGHLFSTCMVNLAVLGLLYGLAGAGLSGIVLAKIQAGGGAANFSPLAVAVVGLLAVYLLHGATALFVWVFFRGLGGRPQLAPHYLNMGVAGIAFWPVAPAVACIQAGIGGVPVMAAAALAGAWGAAVLVAAAKAASGLSSAKMAIAVIATIGYTGCFLYLWI